MNDFDTILGLVLAESIEPPPAAPLGLVLAEGAPIDIPPVELMGLCLAE